MRIEADDIATIPLPCPIHSRCYLDAHSKFPFERAIIELLTVSEQGLPFRLLLEIIHDQEGMKISPSSFATNLEQLVLLI